MRQFAICGVIALTAAAVSPASATTVLSGAVFNNVMIDGTSYNVTFLDESLSQVPVQFQFTFGNFSTATDAVKAIIATPDYTARVAKANTGTGTYYTGFIVPYGALSAATSPTAYRGAVYQAVANKNAVAGEIDDFPLYYYATNNVNTTGDYTVVGYPVTAYALPSGIQLADLPEPSSIAIVALGLFGFSILRRRA